MLHDQSPNSASEVINWTAFLASCLLSVCACTEWVGCVRARLSLLVQVLICGSKCTDTVEPRIYCLFVLGSGNQRLEHTAVQAGTRVSPEGLLLAFIF